MESYTADPLGGRELLEMGDQAGERFVVRWRIVVLEQGDEFCVGTATQQHLDADAHRSGRSDIVSDRKIFDLGVPRRPRVDDLLRVCVGFHVHNDQETNRHSL